MRGRGLPAWSRTTMWWPRRAKPETPSGSQPGKAQNPNGRDKNFAGGSEMSATAQSIDTKSAAGEQELTDGFHLIIDALKLNGINTLYAVPGIPITDFLRMSQAEGIRVLSFRHEQNA